MSDWGRRVQVGHSFGCQEGSVDMCQVVRALLRPFSACFDRAVE
jgi:hypothetical protein